MAHKAVFLDRDGTIIEDADYLDDPAGVKLLQGADLALKSLAGAGYKLVIVTNQSGVARGLLTAETLEKIHERLRAVLAERGAAVDAIYACPYHPEGTVPAYTQDSDLRKPAPGMLLKAAEELDLDLAASWMIGDSDRDVEAGRRAGCRTVRIRSRPGEGPADTARPDAVVRNLVDAARVILRRGDRPGAQAAGVGQGASKPAAHADDAAGGATEARAVESAEESREVGAAGSGGQSVAAASAPPPLPARGRGAVFRPARAIGIAAQIVATTCGVLTLVRLGAGWRTALPWAVAAIALQAVAAVGFLAGRRRA